MRTGCPAPCPAYAEFLKESRHSDGMVYALGISFLVFFFFVHIRCVLNINASKYLLIREHTV